MADIKPALTDARIRAAELLTAEAASICECHTTDGKDWTGEDDAKAAHDEMLAVAEALAAQASAQPAAHTAVMRQALEALELGRDALAEQAAQFHTAMPRYRPARHAAMDADVAQADAAIAALQSTLSGGNHGR